MYHTLRSDHNRLLGLLTGFMLLLLSGCGDDGTNAASSSVGLVTDTTQTNQQQGSWRRTQRLGRFDVAAVNSSLQQSGLAIPTELFQYNVELYQITYTTLHNGSLIDASGVIALPQKNSQLSSPLLSFQHGTIFYNRQAPSQSVEPANPAVLFASMGYITMAADYIGYGITQGEAHPYLQKEPAATVVIDLLSAAKSWLTEHNFRLNDQLFLTGYSQGGSVTMAAHYALEQQNHSDLKVTASLPAAGPYHLVATLDHLTRQTGFRQHKSATLAANNLPTYTRGLPVDIAETLSDFILDQLVPSDSDIVISDSVLYEYLRTDGEATIRHNVHDWQATAPVRLFHGRQDDTVPFFNARDALSAMQARQSADIVLIECLSVPADHDGCIADYGLTVADYFGGIAHGL